MDWATADADPVHSSKTTTLARRERPQLMLGGSASYGSSYGAVSGGVLVSAAEDCDSFVKGRQTRVQGCLVRVVSVPAGRTLYSKQSKGKNDDR